MSLRNAAIAKRLRSVMGQYEASFGRLTLRRVA